MKTKNDTPAQDAEATHLEVVESAPKEKKGKSPEEKAAEKEAQRRSYAISVASAQGDAKAAKYIETAEGTLQRLLGDKVVVSKNGLSIAEGALVSEDDAMKLIGTMLGVDKKEKDFRATLQRSIGDLIIAIKGAFGDEAGDQLVQNIASERGQSKHTIQECERTMRWANEIWGFDERPVGLYFTHFQDGKNYTRTRDGKLLLPKEKIREVFAAAAHGEVVSAGTKADGTPFEHREPWTTSKLREAFTELLPEKQPATPKAAAGPPAEASESSGRQKDEYIAPKGYFYIQDNANVFWSEDLEMEALELKDEDGETDTYTIIIDLEGMCLLNRRGKKMAVISDLPTIPSASSAELEAVEMP